MTLQQALSRFLKALKADGKSSSTIRWYEQRLNRFVARVGDMGLEQVGIDALRDFLADLRDCDCRWEHNRFRKPVAGGLSPSTIQGYVRAIKALFNWLVDEGDLEAVKDPARKLKKPRVPKLPPKGITVADLRAVIAAAHTTRASVRNLAVLLFLADTGCRVGGLVGLRLADLDLGDRSALVTEKGGKGRFVFFGEQTRAALEAWLAVRPQGSDYVFVGQRGPLTVYSVNQMLSKLKRAAGVTGRVNPHAFRHGFAKRYLANGGDLASLADLMGHTDVTVTKNSYSVFLTDELRRKHDQHVTLETLLAV